MSCSGMIEGTRNRRPAAAKWPGSHLLVRIIFVVNMSTLSFDTILVASNCF